MLEKSSVFGPQPLAREVAGAVVFSCSIATTKPRQERWVFYRIDLRAFSGAVTSSSDSTKAAQWWVQDGQRELVLWISSQDQATRLMLVGRMESDSLVGWWHHTRGPKGPWARGAFVMHRSVPYRDQGSCVGA